MTYNLDELEAPEWLNDEFFCNVMRESNNDPTIELTSACVLRPGTNKGDHYASVMFRTTVKYRSKRNNEEKSVNIIMKTKPEAEGLKKELLDDDSLFAIELEMYSKTLPEMARMLKEIGEEYKFPRYIYGMMKPRTILILEDISDQGWVMGDFISTFDDMKPIVKDIAMFHAASVMIESSDSTFAGKHAYSMGEKFMAFEGMVNKGFGDLMQLTASYPEFAHFAEPLEKFKVGVRDFYVSLYNSTKTYQNVLIHGDFHSKNMLHQVDAEGRHTDTILLDYQICCWTTPAIDLYYLLDMIPTQEIKDKHRSELIYMYYQQFSDLLKRLGFLGKIPSLLDLQIELLRYAGLELFHYAVFSSFRYMDQNAVDIEGLLKGEVDNPVLNNPEFKKLMHSELSRFLHQGTLSSKGFEFLELHSPLKELELARVSEASICDELEAPEWLNDEFFCNVMRESNNDPTIELTSACVLRPGTNKGDHYASVMFRTTVKYRSKRNNEEKSVNIIMKTKPEAEGLKKELLDDDSLFAIELEMYSKTLPEMARMLKEIGEEYKFPRYIYGMLKPRTILILEDISDQGWVMGDFISTFDDMKPIVKDIAMFHAASVMIESSNPTFADIHTHSMGEKFMAFEGMINKGFRDMMQLTASYPEFAHFAKPLEKFKANLREFYVTIDDPTKTYQNVLIHGDFHYKNMLHQVDAEGRHTDTILLDYQICCWTTPAIDLYYLLDMIPTQEIKDKHRSELIYMYYQQFSDLLKRLGFLGKIPSLLDLQIELLRYAGLELFHYVVFDSFRYLDQSTVDIEGFLKGEIENPGNLFIMQDPAPELAWINRDYFTHVLETYLHADVTVERYELAAGCPGGQNFMSAIVRATVHYTLPSTDPTRPETVSLIVKTKLANAELAEGADQLNVFGIEKTVYGPVLKAVRELLTSFGDCTQFAPRFIYEDEHALVLEDLAVKGYRQPDRRERLDQHHMRLIVQKLAKFHAATAVLGRKNRDLFSGLASTNFASEGNPIHLFYANAIQHCIDQTVRVPELSQYTEFLRSFLEQAIEREARSYECDESGFNVLNHGDMWLNNLLWKYETDGIVSDVIMVDYQESFYGSPAFDLNHLLYSSANSVIQRAGFDDLVQLYTDELLGALRQFKYDGPLPDLARVRTEMASKRDHALIVTTCIVPPLILENSELATPENMLGDHEEAVRTREEIFSNPKFIEILTILLPRLTVDGVSS
ncbi:uncharacterized protein LOC126567203 [Anopheles maculipalpis]|uniref:uncharacterized protein LOC126567203 n=1 Tax=Anopheles maculipalpis TaxID=1496333 RepID=UPI0021599362|nr:uncharacterized protein LOC126567203 [Anopheles maculipalpis]